MTAASIVDRLLEADEIDPSDIVDPKKFIMTRPQPKSIAILGRHWWRRGAGGTYYTSHIYIDGNKVHVTPENGGSGLQYLQAGTDWLEDEGYIPKRPNGTPGWAWIRDHLKIPLEYSAQDVKRERDLF
jgi:hypothetical protein